MMWIQKDFTQRYSVYVTLRFPDRERMMRVNELDKTAYHVFLEYLKQMSFSSHLPFYYYFPSYGPMPEARVRIAKSKDNCYCVEMKIGKILNLGSYLLSEMNQSEFDILIGQLENLASSEYAIGVQVIFPLVKDIFNDK